MKTAFILLSFLLAFGYSPAWGKAGNHQLAQRDLQRLKMIQEAISEVEKKSLQQMAEELESMPHREVNLRIKEAMAKTYADIIREHNVTERKKKEWLYSMVALNMAYLQFTTDKNYSADAKNLDKLIRRKLIEYLPSDIFNQPGFKVSLE